MRLDPGIEDEYRSKGRLAGRVSLLFKNGQRLEARSLARGQPYYPMSREEIINKFEKLANVVLKKSRVRQILQRVERLESLQSVADQLSPLLINN